VAEPASRRGEAVSLDIDLAAALRRARAGREDGFKQLWVTLQPPLLRYLRVKAGEGAEDVASETWLQVVRDLRSFRGNPDDFRRWLFTVARNRATDAARARRARPVQLVADVHLHLDTVAPSAESVALERLSTGQALALLMTLPPEQAEMVALRVIAGLDVASVADIVGKSPGAVRISVHRGLRLLSAQARSQFREGVELP
jgi:RNA polymerase sigma-70 factor (ECF subfamily)